MAGACHGDCWLVRLAAGDSCTPGPACLLVVRRPVVHTGSPGLLYTLSVLATLASWGSEYLSPTKNSIYITQYLPSPALERSTASDREMIIYILVISPRGCVVMVVVEGERETSCRDGLISLASCSGGGGGGGLAAAM